MYINDPLHFVSAPNFIIDANSGEILKSWDDLTHKKVGQGLGVMYSFFPIGRDCFNMVIQ